jgi:tetratricopeptide (TPR) repeat protein
VHNAFASSGRASAETGWQRLAATLDGYVRQWGAMYVDACEATHLRGEQSAEVLDLRMACLNDNLDQVRALTDALTTTDGQGVAHAVAAATNLTPVARCADVALLRSELPLPRDEQHLQTVLSLRRALAEVEALREIGSMHPALTKALALRQQVEASRYQPLLGRLLEQIGSIEAEFQWSDGEKHLEDAVFVAEAARDDLTVARAAASLAFFTGFRRGELSEGQRWGRLADAALDRLPPGSETSRIRGWVLQNRGAILWTKGDFEAAIGALREAAALKERVMGPDHPDLAVTLTALGLLLTEAGLPQQALVFHARAIRIARTQGDPGSPWLSNNITNFGYTLLALRRLDEAASAFDEALEILAHDGAFGSPYSVEPLAGLGRTRLAQGEVASAVPLLEKAARLGEAFVIPPFVLADVRFALARALWDSRGDRDRALELAAATRQVYVATDNAPRREVLDAWIAGHRSANQRRLAGQ